MLSRTVLVLLCICSLLGSVLLLRLEPPKAYKTVEIVTSDWAPYVDPSQDKGGPVGEMVSAVLDRKGFKSQVVFSSWESGLEKVENGSSFAVFPMVKSEDRLEKYVYSDPLVEFRYVLFHRSGVKVPSKIKTGDFSGYKIGKIAGYDYWQELDNSGAEFMTFSSTIKGFEALAEGEIDFLAESELVGESTLGSVQFEGDASQFDFLKGANPALSSSDHVHFLMRKNSSSANFIEEFNTVLSEFKQTERYEEIVRSLANQKDNVTISSNEPVTIKDPSGKKFAEVIPGTQAQVLKWPGTLERGERVRVKLTNGPLAGRTGFVPFESLVMSDV